MQIQSLEEEAVKTNAAAVFNRYSMTQQMGIDEDGEEDTAHRLLPVVKQYTVDNIRYVTLHVLPYFRHFILQIRQIKSNFASWLTVSTEHTQNSKTHLEGYTLGWVNLYKKFEI